MIDIRDFGASEDATPAHNRAAIQAALDAAKPTWASQNDWKGSLLPDKPRSVYVPAGRFVVDGTLTVYGRTEFCGENRNASQIVTASSVQNAPLIELLGAPGHIEHLALDTRIHGLGLQAEGVNCPIITYRNTPGSDHRILSFHLHDLHLAGPLQMIFDTDEDEAYIQHARIERIFSTGYIDQILRFGGNHIFIDGIDKEQATGHGPEPYIHLKGHRDGQTGVVNRNYIATLRNVLLQQQGSANKSAIKVERYMDVRIENCWTELTAAKHHLELDAAENVKLINTNFNSNAPGKIKLRNNSSLYIDNLPDQTGGWPALFDIDDTSRVDVGIYRTFQGVQCQGGKNVALDKSIATIMLRDANPEFLPDVTPEPINSMLPNQYFEDGIDGWTWLVNQHPLPTVSLRPSPFGRGQLVKAEWDAPISGQLFLRRNWTATAEHVGMTLAVSARLRVTGGGKRAFVQAFGGLHKINSVLSPVRDGDGWQLVTIRVPIKAAGGLVIGVGFESPDAGVAYEVAEIAASVS